MQIKVTTEPTLDAVPAAPPSTPGLARSPERRAAREQASVLLDRAITAAGASSMQLGYALGVSRDWVRQRRDPGQPPAVTLGDVLAMRRRAPSVWRELMRGLVELDAGVSGPGLTPLQHVARVASEAGDVARVTAEAMADGKLDAREVEAIEHEVLQTMTALEAMMRDLRGAK